MSECNYNKYIDYLPELTKKYEVQDDKFLFFFDSVNLEETFLALFSLKTGVLIFWIITLIQTLSSFLGIFSSSSFIEFITSFICFPLYGIICLYIFLGFNKEKYEYSKVGYLLISCLFILNAVCYFLKSFILIIEFITPWDGEFLNLSFLIYVFGYGLYLFVYLYFIYILYRYMLQVKNNQLKDNNNNNSLPKNSDKIEIIDEENKNN